MGVQLLNRGYRSISFTPEGERLFRVADSAVQQLQDAFEALASDRQRPPVTITASIGVTALWLLPRLGDFQQRYPNIDIRLAANNKVFDLAAEGADLAVRYCAAKNAPQGSVRLFGEAIVPVAHPSLAVKPLTSPGAIEEQVLLEFDDPRRPWLQWADRLKVMGLGGAKPKGILRFNQYDQVISGSPDRPGHRAWAASIGGADAGGQAPRHAGRGAARRLQRLCLLAGAGRRSTPRRCAGRDRVDQSRGFSRRIKWPAESGRRKRTGRRCDRRPVSPIRSRL